ncbi:MinD/ParA family protein [Natrialbaceae archaeon A-arb3/5]
MIVAVVGGKGGVGKSTVALNLARELDVPVVDADLSAPDLPHGAGPDVREVLAGHADPVDAIEQHGTVRVLSCGRTLSGSRVADLSALGEVLNRLAREFSRVVVDCPAGLARDVGRILHCADVAVLVTTPSRPALLDAFRTRRLGLDLGTRPVATVLNRSTNGDGERLADRVEATFETPVTVVEERAAIDEARRAGTPIRDVAPNAAAEPFAAVARTIDRCGQRSATGNR